jgi:hypothetical protein
MVQYLYPGQQKVRKSFKNPVLTEKYLNRLGEILIKPGKAFFEIYHNDQ